MFRKWNRFLAFLLSLALVITTFGSDFASAKVYAEGVEETVDQGGGSDDAQPETEIEDDTNDDDEGGEDLGLPEDGDGEDLDAGEEGDDEDEAAGEEDVHLHVAVRGFFKGFSPRHDGFGVLLLRRGPGGLEIHFDGGSIGGGGEQGAEASD